MELSKETQGLAFLLAGKVLLEIFEGSCKSLVDFLHQIVVKLLTSAPFPSPLAGEVHAESQFFLLLNKTLGKRANLSSNIL